MSDRVPAAQLRRLLDRDGHVCVMTGTEGDRLVPQHRQGGMGGRKDKHRLVNLLWLDSLLNGAVEADADLQATAKAWGVKVPIWVDDVSRVPVFFPLEQRWFVLEGDTRREVSAVEALDMMHDVYGDDFYSWKAVSDQTVRSAVLYRRGGAW